MNLKSYDKEKVVIEFSQDEFSDIMSMVHSIGVEFDSLDAEIHMTPEDRVESIVKSIYDIAEEMEIKNGTC